MRKLVFLLLLLLPAMAHGQDLLAPVACQQFFATNGTPLAGGLLYTYQSGTLTPQATYTDATGLTPNANPIILNSGGFATNSTGGCGIFLNPVWTYRFVLQNSLGVQQWLVDGISAQNGSLLLAQPNTWTSLQTFNGGITVNGTQTLTGGQFLGTGSPAYQSGTGGPPIPTLAAAEEGSSGSGVTARNLNTPLGYWSRWDSSDNTHCQSGLIDACTTPVGRIDLNIGNTGTTDTGMGLLINVWGMQGLTPLNGAGGTALGLGVILADAAAETGNTDMFGVNYNVTVNGNPSGLDRAGFTRAIFTNQNNIVNSSGNDCKFQAISGSGNYCGGISLFAAGANNSTVGITIGSTASAGKGFLTGIDSSGDINLGYMQGKTNSINTSVGFMAAGGGGYGFAVGGTSVTPPVIASETLAPPAVGVVFEPKTVAGNNDSIPELFRVFAADTSHVNEWQINARQANTSLRWAFGNNCAFTIGTNPSPCASYTDVLQLTSASLLTTGSLCASQTFGATPGVCLSGNPAPTAARSISAPDGNSQTVMTASLSTSAATTDTVAITGMTASGHCTFSPTNASAATNIATAYISNKTANQITLSHTATGSMTFDFLCTAN